MHKKVSVIIPYSESITPRHQLNKAINSVKSQNIPTEIFIQKENGVSNARNAGLKASNTRYVAFLDADDVWKATKLEQQLKQIHKTGCGICLTKSENFDGEIYDPVRNSEEEFVRDLFLNNIIGFTSTILVDTNKVNAKFNPTLYRREDHAFIIQAVQEAGICFVPNILVYRLGRGLSSNEIIHKKIQAHRHFYEMATDHYPWLSKYKRQYWHAVYAWASLYSISNPHSNSRISYFLRALFYKPSWPITLIKLIYNELRN